ncbi:MAG: hypothetical protein HXY25_08065 [Alphaproteobacteria bacterium]|nr:hypothetical protein [Alphaproteobacteria bacterium]
MLAYEELRGAEGREAYFRLPRYEARKLFPDSPPRVRAKAGSYRLVDLSLGGLSVLVNEAPALDVAPG